MSRRESWSIYSAATLNNYFATHRTWLCVKWLQKDVALKVILDIDNYYVYRVSVYYNTHLDIECVSRARRYREYLVR